MERLSDDIRALHDDLLRLRLHELTPLAERTVREQRALDERFAQQTRLRDDEHRTLHDLITADHKSIDRLRADIDRSQDMALKTGTQLARVDGTLRRLLHASPDAASLETPLASALGDAAFDYFLFETRFRGSEDDIRRRQQNYVDLFRDAGATVLDIGCGRGEFLELLRNANIPARGADMELDMVLACRGKGLDVVQDDAFHYLETLQDESLGGVFSAQVIEHLEPSRMMNLIVLCHRKLRPGGTIVLETLNPQCGVGMNFFYMDPSHVRPVHPDMLHYFLQSITFADVTVRYILGTVDVSTLTDDWRRANCPEYAVVARK
jgi:2-polyprenyl-3-methyl-5-hydroxy-6-metoxy-1,4-benzoquinol methylase